MFNYNNVPDENFRTLVENSIDGMIVADQNAQIAYANQRSGELLGYSVQELLTLSISDIVPDDLRQELLARFQNRLRDLHDSAHNESYLKRKDGSSLPVLISSAKGYWRGALAGILIFYDNTQRKKAEDELRENERKFSNLISNLPGMFFRCKPDHDWMHFVSKGAEELTGYEPEDLLQRRFVSYVSLIHPEDRGRVRKIVTQCLGNQKPWRMEYRIFQRGKRERWVWEQGNGVFNDEGQVKYLEGFITDITESKRTQEALKRTEERRTRAEQLAYVGELAARLNHEIKNPLATIRTGLELVSRGLAPDDANRSVLDTVVSEIQNVNQLVSGLLSAAAIDHFQPRPVMLQTLLQEMILAFEPLGRRKDIKLELERPMEPIVITFDTKAFRRFFGNLVINAFDVLQPNGLVKVACRMVSEGEIDQLFSGFPGKVAAVSITDNGPGISRDEIDKIFTPFFTTKAVGTGLGLSIAHDVIEAQGGLLTVSSEPEKGATFTAYLPVGERPPCFTMLPEKKDACNDCPVKEDDLCWLHRKADCNFGVGGVGECMTCPVYQRFNLNYYATLIEPEVSKCEVPYFWWTMNSI